MEIFKIILFLLCVVTSFACTIFLLRAYFQNKVRLLLWSGLCFVALTVNNIILFLDLIIFPDNDLYLLRYGATIIGLSLLIYGFIWDTD